MAQKLSRVGYFIMIGACAGFLSYAALFVSFGFFFFFVAFVGGPEAVEDTAFLFGLDWVFLIFSLGLGAIIGYLFSRIDEKLVDVKPGLVLIAAFPIVLIADVFLLGYFD